MKSPVLKRNKLVSTYVVEIIIFLIILAAVIILNAKMIRDGLNGMHDTIWHATWLQHFHKQLSEGFLYPRWLSGTNYGYGSPTFVFYPPLVYYFGSLFLFLGLNAENTLILLFSFFLFLCGYNFYILGRNRWGRFPACFGAIAYMSLPYLAYDIYWRGGLASMMAQALIPLGLHFTDLAIKRPKWGWLLSICWALMALTHLPSLLLCALIWLPYFILKSFRKSWRNIVATLVFTGIGMGMASFYLLPVIFEKSFVSIEVMQNMMGGYEANMFGNFDLETAPVTLRIISSAFKVQSIMAAISLSTVFFCWRLKPKQSNIIEVKEIFWWTFFMVVVAFLMSSLSLPIWKLSSTLQQVQFPWRFLQIFSLGPAALFAIAIKNTLQFSNLRLPFFFSIGVCLLTLIYNVQDFRQFAYSIPTLRNPGRSEPVVDIEYLSTIFNDPFSNKLPDVEEYRPLVNQQPPPPPKLGQEPVSVLVGDAEIVIDKWMSYQRQITVSAQTFIQVKLRTYYYPAWHLYVNQIPKPIQMADDGTIIFDLEPGNHLVDLKYQATQSFKIGLLFSLLSTLLLIVLPRYFTKFTRSLKETSWNSR